MSDPRVVLLTTMYSPFQNDLARALVAQGLDYHVIYTVNRKNHSGENRRGKHWTSDRAQEDYLIEMFDWDGPRDLASHLDRTLTRLRPDVLVATGILRAHTYRALQQVQRSIRRIPTGYWLEHPDLSRGLAKRVAIESLVRYQLRKMDFVLAIGDKAQRFYRSCREGLPVHLVPYGQDLSHHFAIERAERSPEDPVTFLFSGQLLPRNNIRNLLEAFDRLAQSHPGRFRFIVAASGPEEAPLRELMHARPAFGTAVTFDREYDSWLDRIRPFANADVLVCPSVHAGWGLVVPEAMAAGMPVITTRDVGSARYFVRSEVNGLDVDGTPDDIYLALRRFVDEPAAIRRMGDAARYAAEAGTAEYVAQLFAAAVRQHAP